MDKSLLDGVIPFLAVAEHLSFTRAASALDITPTAISKAIRVLERRHGVMLFQRTTRSVALTEAGASLYQKLRTATADIGDAFAVLDGYQDRPTGTLRLTMSRTAMALVVEPIISEYRELCPDVVLELSLDDSFVDLVDDNFDAGIRLGEAIEKDMIAVRLTPEVSWSIVGSPAYFARAGRPERPADLIDHEAILYRFATSGTTHHWEFVEAGQVLTVEMKSRLILNDRAAMVRLACQGLGLAFASDAEAGAGLAAGLLQPVLRDFIPRDNGLFLYFPARMQGQPKLRAFIDIATKLSTKPGFVEILRGRQSGVIGC